MGDNEKVEVEVDISGWIVALANVGTLFVAFSLVVLWPVTAIRLHWEQPIDGVFQRDVTGDIHTVAYGLALWIVAPLIAFTVVLYG